MRGQCLFGGRGLFGGPFDWSSRLRTRPANHHPGLHFRQQRRVGGGCGHALRCLVLYRLRLQHHAAACDPINDLASHRVLDLLHLEQDFDGVARFDPGVPIQVRNDHQVPLNDGDVWSGERWAGDHRCLGRTSGGTGHAADVAGRAAAAAGIGWRRRSGPTWLREQRVLLEGGERFIGAVEGSLVEQVRGAAAAGRRGLK